MSDGGGYGAFLSDVAELDSIDDYNDPYNISQSSVSRHSPSIHLSSSHVTS